MMRAKLRAVIRMPRLLRSPAHACECDVTPDQWVTFGSGMAVILGALGAWLKWVRPRYKAAQHKFTAAVDSIVGREAITDTTTGRELAPSLPGIGVRMANTEEHVKVLAEAVSKLADSHARLDDHESRLAKLETAAVERIVSRADSAAAFRAMEAIANGDPEDVDK